MKKAEIGIRQEGVKSKLKIHPSLVKFCILTFVPTCLMNLVTDEHSFTHQNITLYKTLDQTGDSLDCLKSIVYQSWTAQN